MKSQPTSNGWKIPANWWLALVLLVDLRNHLDITRIMRQDAMVLLLDGQARQTQALEFLEEPEGALGVGDALETLVHEDLDRRLQNGE